MARGSVGRGGRRSEQSAAAAALITPHCALGAIRRARELENDRSRQNEEKGISRAQEKPAWPAPTGVSGVSGQRHPHKARLESCVIHAAIDSA